MEQEPKTIPAENKTEALLFISLNKNLFNLFA